MAANTQHYDRDAEDLGNIVGLEHVFPTSRRRQHFTSWGWG
jgi:hypothetical protein